MGPGSFPAAAKSPRPLGKRAWKLEGVGDATEEEGSGEEGREETRGGDILTGDRPLTLHEVGRPGPALELQGRKKGEEGEKEVRSRT